MRNIGTVLLGVLLLAAFFGVLGGMPARTASAAPLVQRVTSTPAPARTVPTATPTATLSVARMVSVTPSAPLTMTAVLTTPVLTTAVLLPVQIVAASTFLTDAASVTPTVVVAPLATMRPAALITSTSEPSDIVDLRAVPARLRGRIDLSWVYRGGAFDGTFLVERSTNGSVWRFVKECIQPYDAEAKAYKCSDVDLTSGTAYSYRACVVEYGTACTSPDATEPVTVKAP